MPNMDLVDNVIKSNLFLYSHNVQRRDEYLRALYCMQQGMWICSVELVMETLCIFRDKGIVGCKGLKGTHYRSPAF